MYEYLTEHDKELIEKISGYPIENLLREVPQTAWSTERLIFDRDLNKKGLQILRCVLSQRLNEVRQNLRAHKYDVQAMEEFRRDGCLIRHDVFSEKDVVGETIKINDRFVSLVQMTLGDDTIPEFQLMTVQKMPATRDYYDVQTESHFDTFHPTCKVWVYLNEITPDHAPLHFAKGTHQITENRLRFMYELSCKLDKIEAGDFRDFKHQFDEPQPILGPRFTTIFVDVSAFHKRGIGKPGNFRISARGDIARKNPFRDLNV